MATLLVTPSRVVPTPRQSVIVNGALRRDVIAREVQLMEGIRASQCMLWIPTATADADIAWMHEAEVRIYIAGHSAPIFLGYVFLDTAHESADHTGLNVRAYSVLGLLDRLAVGQGKKRGGLVYPIENPETGERTGWTKTRIVEDLFSPENMPSEWRQKIRLGTLVGLLQSGADPRIPKIRFEHSYIEAIQRVMNYAPDVGMAERFTHSGTVLDFYLLGRGQLGTGYIQIATAQRGPERGAWVQDWRHERATDRVYNRAIGYGRHNEHLVTVWNGHATAPLEPAWEGAEDLEDFDPLDPETYGERENLIRQYPERANPASPAYAKAPDGEDGTVDRPDIGEVFRRWRLPLVLRENDIIERSELEDSGGRSIGLAVFRAVFNFPTDWNEGDSVNLEAQGFKPDEFEEIRGWELDEQGFLLLPQAPFAIQRYNSDESVDYAFTNVYVTLITSRTKLDERVRHDTGVRGRINYPGLSQEGLVFQFINRDLTRFEIGANDIVDSEEQEHDFGAIWHDEVEGWQIRTNEETEVLVDDQETLTQLTETALRERVRPLKAVEATNAVVVPVRIGTGLIVRGRSRTAGIRYHVDSVTMRLIGETKGTAIRANNVRPPAIEPARVARIAQMGAQPMQEQAQRAPSTMSEILRERGLPTIGDGL